MVSVGRWLSGVLGVGSRGRSASAGPVGSSASASGEVWFGSSASEVEGAVKIVVGLGNPGQEYGRTRHNAGFMVLDRVASRWAPGALPRGRFQGLAIDAHVGPASSSGGWGAAEGSAGSAPADAWARALLLKPTTYMNLSGRAVGEAVRFFKADPTRDLLVVVDEVAFDVGVIRLGPKGSAGGHNGLADIERALGSSAYPRLRVGVGPAGRAVRRDYVLGAFTESQRSELEPALDAAASAVAVWATEGLDAAMNRFNKKNEKNEKNEKSEKSEPGEADRPGERR